MKAMEELIADIEAFSNSSPFPIGDIPTLPRQRREKIASADISSGKEKRTIRAVNGVDYDPAPVDDFTYIIHPIYSSLSRLRMTKSIGCSCEHGCSESRKCPCVLANKDSQIPFNSAGRFPKYREDGIYECGPACKCSSEDCDNRVGQSGPGGHRLELFKTDKKGWGVRSHDAIPKGGFICEYVGEILLDDEAEEMIGADKYLYNLVGGFTIDGAKYGNVGRFINHSCEPNAFAQNVFYCGGEKIMPHIMFFASKEIPPLQEIFYFYNYKIGSVCVDGVEQVKACHCGAPRCRKRLY